jgi:hypothetical protein
MNPVSDLPCIKSLKGVKLTPQFVEKFESRINRDGPAPEHCPEIGNCHLWTGSTAIGRRMPYGRISHEFTVLYTHRVSYELYIGTIPDGISVLHRCDVPRCCRPEHLFLGTHDDNMADMVAKGRLAPCYFISHPEAAPRGDDHWTRKTPGIQKGAGNGRATLTEADVIFIRQCYASKTLSVSEMAARFGMDRSQIWKIGTKRQWSHI